MFLQDLKCHTSNSSESLFSNLLLDDISSSAFYLFVCVKPAIVNKCSQELFSFIKLPHFCSLISERKLHIVSTVAGVNLQTFVHAVNDDRIHVSRIMANIACGVRAGAMGLVSSSSTLELNKLKQLLSSIGVCIEVQESQMDAVCGLAGSGIAYVISMYSFIFFE